MFSDRNSLKRMVRRLGLASLAAGAIGLVAHQALGVDYDWQGPSAANRSGNWTLGSNWVGAGAPPDAVDDTASILLAGDVPYTVTLNTSPTIGFLTLNQADATFLMSSRTLTLLDGADLLAGKMTMTSSTLKSSVIGMGTLIHNIDTTITGGGNFDFGTFTNGGKITIQGSGGATATMNSSNGFTNNGLIELTSSASTQATLNITGAGALLNGATGVLAFQFGASTGHIRNLGAHLSNLGTVNIEAGTTVNLNRSEGLFVNENAFNIGAGAILAMNAGGRVFTQQAGTLDNQGAFNITNATLNFNGGQITGNAVTISAGTLNIGPGSTGQGSFTFLSASNHSGDVAAGQTLHLLANSSFTSTLTAASGFVNNGLIRLDSSASTQAALNVTSGTLTNAAMGTLEFLFGTSSGHTRQLGASLDSLGLVTVEAGATLNLTKTGGSYINRGQFNIGAGAFVNSGVSQVFIQEAGTLDNQGSMTITGGNAFTFNGGQITGNPILFSAGALNIGPGSMGAGAFTMVSAATLSGDVAHAQMIKLQGNSSFTATLTAATGFTNHGLIQFDSTASTNAALVVTNGTLINAPDGTLEFLFGSGSSHTRNLTASLDNQGLVTVKDGTTLTINKSSGVHFNRNAFNVETNATVNLSGLSQVFTQAAGAVDNLGVFNVSNGATLTFNGGQFTGNSVVIDGSTLNIGPGSIGAGGFTILGVSNWSGDVAAAQTLRILSTSSGAVTLTAASGFSNHGLIQFDSTSSPPVTLTLLSDQIINQPGGTLDFLKGSSTGRVRNLTASLDNRGLVHLEADTVVTMGLVSASHVNTGQINLEAGSILTISGANTSLSQVSGAINNLGGMVLSSTKLILSGGLLTGNPVQVASGTLELPPAAAAAGTVNLTGSNTLIGDVNNGLTVTILSTSGGATTATAAMSFTNHGAINLDSTSSPTSTLAVTTGQFHNAADGVLRLMTGSSSGRTRILNADSVNDGQIIVQDLVSALFNKVGGVHQNNGSIMIGLGGTLNLSGGASILTNQPGGVVGGTGTFQTINSTFLNNGTIAPGNSPGILTINGGFTHAASGILAIEIAGLTVGTEYDRLAVIGTGTTNLNGRLFVELDGFTPQPADTFQVLTNVGTRIGAFSNVTCDRLPVIGGTFQVIYNTGNVTLTDFRTNPGLAADFNGDGAVNALDLDLIGAALNGGPSSPMFDLNQDSLVTKADVDVIIFDILGTFYGDANLNCSVTIGDLTILAEHFNGPGGWAFGDFTGNGIVSIGDLTVLAENFGAGEPLIAAALSGGPTAIPLPPAAWGGLALLGGLAFRRRFGRSQA